MAGIRNEVGLGNIVRDIPEILKVFPRQQDLVFFSKEA